MRYVFLALACFIFSCANDKDDAGPVHYDGIYQTKVLENEATGDTYRYFLRFYDDGTVVSVTSSGTAKDIKKWFKKGHENVNEGEYEVDGDDISFTTSGPGVEVEYSGTIKDKNTLQLESVSSSNGNKQKVRYSFVED